MGFLQIRSYLMVCSTFLLACLLFLVENPKIYAQSETEYDEGANIVRVEKFEFSGVTVLKKQEIESILEIQVGNALDRAKVVKTVENLEKLYKIKGYFDVSIRSELIREEDENGETISALTFYVKEGPPTKISKIEFVPIGITSGIFLRYWELAYANLLSVLMLRQGDVLDQEIVSQGKRDIQTYLALDNFINAKVVDVKFYYSEPKDQEEKEKANWVSLEYHVALGERVSFGFRGNKLFTRSELLDLIEDQRVVGFEKDYVGSIKQRILGIYKEHGFTETEIETYSFMDAIKQQKHVTFVIKEGKRVKIEKIEFDGNAYITDEEIQKKFYLLTSRLVQRNIYVKKDIEQASEKLIEWMKSKGFLEARLVAVSEVKNELEGTFGVTIFLFEGEQTIIRNINIEGVRALRLDGVKKILAIENDEPLNLFAFSSGLEALKAEYQNIGYLDMKVANEEAQNVVAYFHRNRAADVTVVVDEGPISRVGRIQVDGRTLTHESIVNRELVFKKGEVLKKNQIIESETRLRRLGVFSSVRITTFDDVRCEGCKVVRILIDEGTPGLIAGGPGWRSDLGIRAFGQISYSNLWHRSHTVSLDVEANRRLEDFRFYEGKTRLGYLWPWFLMDKMNFRPQFAYELRQYYQFNAQTASFRSILDYPLIEDPNLIVSLTYSLEGIRQFDAFIKDDHGNRIPSEVDNQSLRIGSLIFATQLDLRDHPLSPTEGWFVSGSFEVAHPSFLSQSVPYPVGYTQLQGRIDRHIDLGAAFSAFLSFRVGFERSLIDTPNDAKNDQTNPIGSIPLIKQFALGGVGSLRGFKPQELNLQSFLIRGTAAYVNYRAQIDLPVKGSFKVGPFVDAANLLRDRFSLGDLRYGVGVGARYVTPVGPVNFDMGFKVDPGPLEDPYRFHFSIGVL